MHTNGEDISNKERLQTTQKYVDKDTSKRRYQDTKTMNPAYVAKEARR